MKPRFHILCFPLCSVFCFAQFATASDLSVAGDLSVSGEVDVWGNALDLGTLNGETTALPGVSFLFSDVSGTSILTLQAHRPVHEWIFKNAPGTTGSETALRIGSQHQVFLYPNLAGTTVPSITLDPSGTSTFQGSLLLNGTNNQMPNQTNSGNASILTVGLGDSRYLKPGTMSMGTGNNVGVDAVAIGLLNTGTGQYAFAGGRSSEATGFGTTAIGVYSRATAWMATAIGGGLASGNHSASLALGTSSGVLSLSAGQATASGERTTATGASVASGPYSSAFGGSTASDWFATAGGQSSATGHTSVAFGCSTASGFRSAAFGCSTASGGSSTTGGDSTATNWYASAFGISTASAQSASAGGQSIASGTISTAFGSSVAGGFQSTALGSATATTWGSTAVGYGTATGTGAFSAGWTHATGEYSTAVGYDNTASGNFSMSLGRGTTASTYGQTTVGLFNVPSTGSSSSPEHEDDLFVIGNGVAGAPSNAVVVKKSGNTAVNGDLAVSGAIRVHPAAWGSVDGRIHEWSDAIGVALVSRTRSVPIFWPVLFNEARF